MFILYLIIPIFEVLASGSLCWSLPMVGCSELCNSLIWAHFWFILIYGKLGDIELKLFSRGNLFQLQMGVDNTTDLEQLQSYSGLSDLLHGVMFSSRIPFTWSCNADKDIFPKDTLSFEGAYCSLYCFQHMQV